MYCILSILICLGGFILYDQTGNFDYLFKMLIISTMFGLCDSISSLSIKKFIDTISNYKLLEKDKKDKK